MTSACTKSAPNETIDCWMIDGTATRQMCRRRSSSKTRGFPSHGIRLRRRSSTKNASSEASACAMRVAHATPGTPIPKRMTESRSRKMLVIDESISSQRGVRLSPRALKAAVEVL